MNRTLANRIFALLPLLLVACAKHPPMGDPELQSLLSMKALAEADVVTDCLKRDGVQANLTATVTTATGRVTDAVVRTVRGDETLATDCLKAAIGHWMLDPPLSGQASLIFADDAAEQDARTARVEVGKIVAAHEASLSACHAVAVDRAESLPPSGLVLLAWSLDRRKAVDVKVMSNDTGDPELAQCVVAEVGRWTFPPDAVGDMQWPFEFTGTGPVAVVDGAE